MCAAALQFPARIPPQSWRDRRAEKRGVRPSTEPAGIWSTSAIAIAGALPQWTHERRTSQVRLGGTAGLHSLGRRSDCCLRVIRKFVSAPSQVATGQRGIQVRVRSRKVVPININRNSRALPSQLPGRRIANFS